MYIGIMDIGSNAIRAHVFDDNKLGANQVYNDKFKINLQNIILLNNYEVPHQIYLIIQHFCEIFKKFKINISDVHCVATQVLRNEDGERFAEFIYKKYGLKIKIISGDEEAYLSSCGVLCGIEDADGVVADLGGGSIEIAEIKNKNISRNCSLPLGIKLVKNKNSITVEEIIDSLSKSFSIKECENLYFASGGFRIIGKYYQEFTEYPLKNLHRFEIDRVDFEAYLEKILKAKKSPVSIDNYIVKVGIALIRHINPKNVVISSYGLKDGIRYSILPEEEKQKNILIERTKELIYGNKDNSRCFFYNFEKYRELFAPFIIEDNQRKVLELVDIGLMFLNIKTNIEINLRHSFLTQMIFAVDIPFSHKHRVMLSIILYTAIRKSPNIYLRRISKRILSKTEFSNALIIGKLLCIIDVTSSYLFEEPLFSIEKNEFGKPMINTDKILPSEIFSTCKILLREIDKI